MHSHVAKKAARAGLRSSRSQPLLCPSRLLGTVDLIHCFVFSCLVLARGAGVLAVRGGCAGRERLRARVCYQVKEHMVRRHNSHFAFSLWRQPHELHLTRGWMRLAINLFCALESTTAKGVQEWKVPLSQAPHFADEKIVTQSKIRALDPIPLLLVFPATQTP